MNSAHPQFGQFKTDLIQVYRQALLANVPLEKVEKKLTHVWDRALVSHELDKASVNERQKKARQSIPLAVRWGGLLLPFLLVVVGIGLVANALIPIIGYYLAELPQLRASALTSPIPPDQVLAGTPLVITQRVDEASQDDSQSSVMAPIIMDTPLNFTNLSNWFAPEQASALMANANKEDVYYIDIPTLNINNAEVSVGGTNLNENLIQYPGTALPGQQGSPVIFGHSVLRQFYNPSEKNPRRYNSIFSTIMTMKKGEKIIIRHKNVTYTYLVQDKAEVKPEDTFILAQQYDQRLLKLVTCTPEGTYLRRGVITAVLVPE
jgi:LPXTG-site transpeptidase (sortase) family protein